LKTGRAKLAEQVAALKENFVTEETLSVGVRLDIHKLGKTGDALQELYDFDIHELQKLGRTATDTMDAFWPQLGKNSPEEIKA
jgi:hypothetical protein